MLDPRTDDMWWAARQKTAAYRGTPWEVFTRTFSQSLPGAATRKVPFQILTEGRGMGVDLNTYRPNVNVEMLADMGVKVFDLRSFCPGRWEFDNWAYYQDGTFEGYYTRLMALRAKGYDITIGGYGVYNPWLDETNGYKSPNEPNTLMMKLYLRNFPCDYYMWDVEVGECAKGSNLHNGITGVNLVLGLSRCMQQTLDEMPHWPGNNYPRIPEMYSANWYLKQWGGDPMKVWLENMLKDTSNLPFLTWFAWVPQIFSGTYAKPTDLYDLLLTPNGVQEDAYLHLRSEPLVEKWQCSWTLKGPWSPNVGIDTSLTYGLCARYDRYKYFHNIPAAVTPPEPPQPPNPLPGDYVTTTTFNAHLADKTAHAHGHGGPVALS